MRVDRRCACTDSCGYAHRGGALRDGSRGDRSRAQARALADGDARQHDAARPEFTVRADGSAAAERGAWAQRGVVGDDRIVAHPAPHIQNHVRADAHVRVDECPRKYLRTRANGNALGYPGTRMNERRELIPDGRPNAPHDLPPRCGVADRDDHTARGARGQPVDAAQPRQPDTVGQCPLGTVGDYPCERPDRPRGIQVADQRDDFPRVAPGAKHRKFVDLFLPGAGALRPLALDRPSSVAPRNYLMGQQGVLGQSRSASRIMRRQVPVFSPESAITGRIAQR